MPIEPRPRRHPPPALPADGAAARLEHPPRRLMERRQAFWWCAAALAGGVIAGVALAVALARPRTADPAIRPPNAADTTPDVTVTLSAGLLTALIRQSIERGEAGVPLQDVQADTRDGRIVMRGSLAVLGRQVSGSVDMEPYVDNGRLRVRVISARFDSRFGAVPIPGNLERLAEEPLNARVSAAVGGLPATITSVHVTEKGVTVTARVRTDDLGRP